MSSFGKYTNNIFVIFGQVVELFSLLSILSIFLLQVSVLHVRLAYNIFGLFDTFLNVFTIVSNLHLFATLLSTCPLLSMRFHFFFQLFFHAACSY